MIGQREEFQQKQQAAATKQWIYTTNETFIDLLTKQKQEIMDLMFES